MSKLSARISLYYSNSSQAAIYSFWEGIKRAFTGVLTTRGSDACFGLLGSSFLSLAEVERHTSEPLRPKFDSRTEMEEG
jgi:hypothetical protein